MEKLNFDKVKILAAAATLAMFAGTACALEVFGQVNKAFLFADDGQSAPTLFVDNNFSPSTLGVKSMAHLNKCVTFGGIAEIQFNINNSRLVSQVNNTYAGTHLLFVRNLDAWASAGMWGTLHLGYGDAASYGITDMSFAGTNKTVLGVNVADMAGGMLFFRDNSAGPVYGTDPEVEDVFSSLNGVGEIADYTGLFIQQNRVRWDSGNWCGFTLGVSHGYTVDNTTLGAFHDHAQAQTALNTPNRRQYTDAALRYDNTFDCFALKAGIAWAQFNTNAPVGSTITRGVRVWSGSVAAEHTPTGFNAAVAYGVKRKGNTAWNNYKMFYVQLGKHFCWSEYGKTHFAIDYFQGSDTLPDGGPDGSLTTIAGQTVTSDKSKSYGLGVVQDFSKINTALYAGIKGYKYDYDTNSNGGTTLATFHSMTAVSVGVLFKFGAML